MIQDTVIGFLATSGRQTFGKKTWDLVAFQEANSTLWVLCCQPLLAVE